MVPFYYDEDSNVEMIWVIYFALYIVPVIHDDIVVDDDDVDDDWPSNHNDSRIDLNNLM